MTYNQTSKLMKQFTKVLYMLSEEARKAQNVRRVPLFYESMQRMIEDTVKELMEARFEDLESLHQFDSRRGLFHHIVGHSLRTCVIALSIGKKLGLSQQALQELGMGSLLHDVGKILIPNQIIDKPERLSESEYEIMKRHSEMGVGLLSSKAWMSTLAMGMIQKHHERLDGSGYPSGITEEAFTLFDKIVGVADVFDAITSARVYRKALTYEVALEIIQNQVPYQLDSLVFDSLLHLVKEDQVLKLEDGGFRYAISHV